MSRDALRGATWILAAAVALQGAAGLGSAISTGALALMPSAALAISIGSALLGVLLQLGVAVGVLSRLAKDSERRDPPWLAIVLLLAFGVTGIVLRLGSMWAQSFLVQRAMGMGELADYAMTTSIVSGVTGLLHPLIQMGTLLGAAWLWQSRRGAEAVITE